MWFQSRSGTSRQLIRDDDIIDSEVDSDHESSDEEPEASKVVSLDSSDVLLLN